VSDVPPPGTPVTNTLDYDGKTREALFKLYHEATASAAVGEIATFIRPLIS
jgi:hypothetical protein